MGDYDRIIKENIQQIFLPLIKKFLSIDIKSIDQTDLTEKLQTTIEREPDFLRKVTTRDDHTFILHLEFQSFDEKMIYRMAEYRAILQRKYEIPVRQFVIYLGTDNPKMQTSLSPSEVIAGFELQNLHDIKVDQVIDSQVPEEILLAILTDFSEEDTEKTIYRIISRLQQLSPDESTLKRYIQQLLVLSRLRKLDEKTQKQIKAMPISYDIETDYLYKKAKDATKRDIILEMLKDTSMTNKKIAMFTKTSEEYVRMIREENK